MKGAEFCQITPFLCLLKLRGLSPLLSGVCMMHTYVYDVCDNECGYVSTMVQTVRRLEKALGVSSCLPSTLSEKISLFCCFATAFPG